MNEDAGAFTPQAGPVRDRASAQQRRAASQLHAVADELQQMAARNGQTPAGEVAQQAADRIRSAAAWLEQREPADVLAELRDFARRRPGVTLAGAAMTLLAIRRRPGMVLAGAAVAGLAAGRMAARRAGPQAEPAAAIPPPPDPEWTPMPEHPDVPSAPAGSAPYYPASGVSGPGVAGPESAGPGAGPTAPEEQP
jgi:hypothetical protein